MRRPENGYYKFIKYNHRTYETLDEEIVWRMNKRYHAGLIVRSPDPARVEQLLEEYTERFYTDFFAKQPAPERAIS